MSLKEKLAEDLKSAMKDKDIIRMRYYQGLTQTVIADKLGMTQVQVSRREKAILQELRKRLI